jgi:hypothetical protein
MNGTDEDVRTMMAAGSSDLPAGIDLLRGVRERQAPARQAQSLHRTRALVSAGAVTVVGAAAALGLTLTATVASAPSAFAAVTAAAAKTAAESFTFSIDMTAVASSGNVSVSPGQLIGAFDPANGAGELSTPATPGRQVLFAGGHWYSPVPPDATFAHGKPWVELLSWPALPSAVTVPGGFEDGKPIEPAELLALLKSVATVQAAGPASGPGWSGTKYTFTIAPTTQGGPTTTTGTVYVDSQGRVRRLDRVTVQRVSVDGSQRSITMTDDVRFGGFDRPVKVATPSASQVYNLGQGPVGFDRFVDAYQYAVG